MPITLNGTTGIQNVLGSASAPAESNTTSSNTGLYFPSSTTLGLATNGTAALTIDASQNVGIGTTSPAAPLDVVGNVNAVSYRIRGRASDNYSLMEFVNNAGTTAYGYIGSPTANTLAFFTNGLNERMRIDSSGNVGIGTSSPGTAGGGGSPRTLEVYNATGSVPWGQLVLSTGVAGTTNDVIGGIEFANRGVSGAAKRGATIYAFKSSTSSVNADTYLTFSVNNGGTLSEAMRIDSSGNLLVGTTGLVAKLNVVASSLVSAGYNTYFRNTWSGDVGYPALYVAKYDNNTTTSQIFMRFSVNNELTASGQINANGANSAAFGSFSDERLKENIVNLPSQLENICSLRPVEFDYKDGSGHQIGFVAQEMQEVYPDVVGVGADDMLTITGWSKTEARLVKAIQELKAELDALKALK